jgi:C4-dicarboxylate-specific signal transduction histidine kinase
MSTKDPLQQSLTLGAMLEGIQPLADQMATLENQIRSLASDLADVRLPASAKDKITELLEQARSLAHERERGAATVLRMYAASDSGTTVVVAPGADPFALALMEPQS